MVRPARPTLRSRSTAGGFTYVGLLVLVTVIGLVGAAALKVDALMRRAAAERELLETGAAFADALRSYADATPRGQPTQPPSLQDLLRDPRYPGVRRHLRKIFVDPMTGKAEWGIVYLGSAADNAANNAAGTPGKGSDGSGDKLSGGSGGSLFAAAPAASGAAFSLTDGGGRGTGGIVAVYSLSQARPLKVGNFDARCQNFDNKTRISDWKFAALGQGVTQGTVALPKAGQDTPGMPDPNAPQGANALPAAMPSLFPNRDAAQAVPPAAFEPQRATLTPAPPPADIPAPAVAPSPAPDPAQPAEPAPPAADDKGDEDGKDTGDGRRRVQPPPAENG